MKIIKLTTTDNKKVFKANDVQEMVVQLHKDAWLQETSPEEYMNQVAKRVKIYSGKDVRTDDELSFLLDIEKAGMIRLELEEI